VSAATTSTASILREAFAKREKALERSGAVRIFHGPSEGRGKGERGELSRMAIELFRAERTHAWVFVWEERGKLALSSETRKATIEFLESVGVSGAVVLERPEKGAPADPTLLFGEVPETHDIDEAGLRFRIRYLGTKHPGLFLDHAPLRDWLRGGGEKDAKIAGARVLNTFAYTGSLSVAARSGGAAAVTTLDLSRPTVNWAKENWELNFGKDDSTGDFIFGDVFEWMPKLAKRGERYDVVILDPPSFSRSEKKVFSTAKDLPALHSTALRLLNSGGTLITSINSAQVSVAKFRADIALAAQEEKRRIREIRTLGAPSASFPGADYLKGWILRAD
jgi:23S rRNA (cytosine1962-C5)-methyltransferase